ncbi:hypothetical protein SFRURICE_014547 [Spodoptera frugiperda]|nr:hypothetical protein SFRURICE_014547 [Spodoptera frugiperda]
MLKENNKEVRTSVANINIRLDPGFWTKTSQIQLFYGVWVNLCHLGIGLAYGFPSVQVPQLFAAGSDIKITRSEGSWIASVFTLCSPIGCLISGYVADWLGRRVMIIVCQAPICAGWLYTGFAKRPKQVIIGFGCGLAMGPPRIYCTEMSLPNMRGVIGAFSTVGVSIGITLQAGLGKYLNWPVLCYICSVYTVIVFVLFLFLPETPYFVLKTKTLAEARATLAHFRARDYDFDKEMDQLRKFKEGNDIHYWHIWSHDMGCGNVNGKVTKPKVRGILAGLTVFVAGLLISGSIKLTPTLLDSIGLSYTMVIFGICSLIVLEKEIKLDPGFWTKTSQIQLFYGLWVNLCHLGVGLAFGLPSVQVPQLSAGDSFIKVTRNEASWIASVFTLFSPIGCLISGYVTDWLGRRFMIIVCQAPICVGWLCTGFANSPKQVIIGIGSGMAMTPPRIFASEISLPNMRGVIGCFSTLAISIGITIQAGLGQFLNWPVICHICSIYTVTNFLSFFFLPETPYFLMKSKTLAEARVALKRFRARNYDCDKEMEQITEYKEDMDIRLMFLYMFLPETKNLTLQEIEAYYSSLSPTLVSQRENITIHEAQSNISNKLQDNAKKTKTAPSTADVIDLAKTIYKIDAKEKPGRPRQHKKSPAVHKDNADNQDVPRPSVDSVLLQKIQSLARTVKGRRKKGSKENTETLDNSNGTPTEPPLAIGESKLEDISEDQKPGTSKDLEKTSNRKNQSNDSSDGEISYRYKKETREKKTDPK